MYNPELRHRIVVNFLHHVKGCTVEEAENLYNENLTHVNKVFDLFGEKVMINTLKELDKGGKDETK